MGTLGPEIVGVLMPIERSDWLEVDRAGAKTSLPVGHTRASPPDRHSRFSPASSDGVSVAKYPADEQRDQAHEQNAGDQHQQGVVFTAAARIVDHGALWGYSD